MSQDTSRDLAARLGARLSMEPVRDLWPRRLMLERAGEVPVACPVVRPRTYEEVAEVLRAAAELGVDVVPVGGRSGVCGAVDARSGQLALDLTLLDGLLEVDEANLRCRVQAGMRLGQLESQLNARHLTLGHHPTSLAQATVGGVISTRSSGQESTLHGGIEDMLLGVAAILADGRLLPLRAPARSAAGPALHQLLVGAEGRLAVILEASLRISRLPPATRGRGYRFVNVEKGLEALREISQHGVRPLVSRLYDAEDSLFQGLQEGCLLVVAVAGELEVAEAESGVVARLCHGAEDLGEAPWQRWLSHRYDLSANRLLELLEPAGAVLDTIELGAAWTSLAGLHAQVKAAVGESGLILCHFSHPSPQGCCAYFSFAASAATEPEALALYDHFWEEAMAAAVAHGATITHHHGVGQARRRWIQTELAGWEAVWDRVRLALDPESRLNPQGMGG